MTAEMRVFAVALGWFVATMLVVSGVGLILLALIWGRDK